MPLALVKLLGLPMALLHAVIRWALANPLLCACVLAILWGAWGHHEAKVWKARAQQCQMASQQAQKAQEALHAQERAKYEEQAHEADTRYSADLASVRASTASYIAAHRVQPARIGVPAITVSKTSDAGQPQELPGSDAAVVVSSGDVQACSDWVAYGTALHDWAVSVTE